MIRKFIHSNSDRFVSRWVILLKDVLIVAFSLVSAYLLRFNFQLPDRFLEVLLHQTVLVSVLATVAFLVTNSYRGIIRHTGIQDVVLLAKALFGVLITLISLNLVAHFFSIQWYHIIPYSVLLIFSTVTVFLLITSRLAIKMFYHHVMNKGDKSSKVIIYGAGKAGLIARNTLLAASPNTVVVCFVDENPGKIGKSLEGTPVYSPEILTTDFIAKKGVNEIIFAIFNIEPEKRIEIIEQLISSNRIKVKEIPPVEQWIDGELTSKQIHPIRIEDLLNRESIKIEQTNVVEDLRDKLVMVTGAAGSIGSELARQLCRFPLSRLILLDQAESPLYDLEQEIRKNYPSVINICTFLIADVSNASSINRIFSFYKPQVVYHAAAYKHVPMMEINPHEAVRVNVFGTRILADASIRVNAERFVMVSTDKAVNPTNVMGASKRTAEIYIQSLATAGEMRTRFITTRFGNVLGSNGSVIPLFKKQIECGGPVTVTHPEITRYFMTIPEACRLVLEAGTMGKGGEIFMFDMGKPVKIKDLAIKMIQLSGLEVGKDIKIEYVGLRPGEKLYEELLASEESSVPTHHPKITIARVRPQTMEETAFLFAELENSFKAMDPSVLVSCLKRIVPEFISKNSVFEALDKLREVNPVKMVV